jgi:surface protein
MAVIKVGNNSIGKISVIEPYDDPIGGSDFDYDPSVAEWVRPSEWLDMPSFSPHEEKAAILMFIPSGMSDYKSEIYTRGLASNNYVTYTTIDWGDGNTTVASGTSTDYRSVNYIAPQQHAYNYEDLPASSEFMRNGLVCRQAMIVLDGSASGIGYLDIAELNNAHRPLTGQSNNYQAHNALDVHVEAPNIETLVCREHSWGEPVNIERLVINATGVFNVSSLCDGMRNLRVFEFPSGDTSSLTNFGSMFNACYNLTSVPELDTSSATSVAGMFSSCRSLKEIPQIDTSNVTNFSYFLNDCANVREIPSFDYSNGTNFLATFANMHRVKTVPSGLDFSSATDISSMFGGCDNLAAVPNNIYDNFTNVTRAHGTFSSCRSLRSMPRIDLPNCTYMRFFMQDCSSLESLHIGDVRSMPTAPYDTNGNFREAFQNLTSCKSIEIDYPDETWASGMYYMFGGCASLKKLPEINLSKAYWVGSMFAGCHNAVEAPVYDLSNVNDYNSFFSGCSALRRVGGFKFGERKASTGRQCFYRCYSLQEFPSGLFQDYNSTPDDAYRMFWDTDVQKIPDINVSGLTSTIGSPFPVMYDLTEVGNITFGSGAYLNSFMSSNVLLSHIGDWDVSGVESFTNAFHSCRSLVWSDIRGTRCSIGYYDCFLSSGAIENIFNNLASGVVGQTIDIRLNHGTPLLHSDTLAIATSKGWTVTT